MKHVSACLTLFIYITAIGVVGFAAPKTYAQNLKQTAVIGGGLVLLGTAAIQQAECRESGGCKSPPLKNPFNINNPSHINNIDTYLHYQSSLLNKISSKLTNANQSNT
jgi:hypothetical protein